jgi:hypothetical protein
MKTIKTEIGILTLTMILAFNGRTQPVTYVGDIVGAGVQLYDPGRTSLNLVPSGTFIQITTSPQDLTLNYNIIQYQIASTTNTFTENLSTGFGTSANFIITLAFDPTTLTFSSKTNFTTLLVPSSGELYNVVSQSYDNPRAPLLYSGEITGSYTVTGPQHTVTGTFQIGMYPFTGSGNDAISEGLLDTSSYPGSLGLTFPHNGNELFYSPAGTLVNTSLDGANVNVSDLAVIFSGQSDTLIPVTIEPQLTIIPSGTNVNLSWPTNVPSFNLEWATNLALPIVWNTNSTPPVVLNGQNVVTNPICGSQMFFRLSQ